MTKKSFKSWYKHTLYYASMGFCALILIWVPFQSLMGTFGAQMEMRIIQPLLSFEIREVVCVDESRGLAAGVIDKTAYPGGIEADFIGMTIYDTNFPRNRLPWHRPAQDSSPQSLPPGKQSNVIVIEGGCHTPFRIHTRHRSPLTGNILRMSWPQDPLKAFNTPSQWEQWEALRLEGNQMSGGSFDSYVDRYLRKHEGVDDD